jgi:putative redox protein
MEVRVQLNYEADEQYQAVNENGNTVSIDMLPKEQKQHQSPMELLLSALVACAAVDLVSMIKKRRKTLVDLKGQAVGQRREEHPRGYTQIHLKYFIYSPDLTDEEAARLVELACTKYCSVAASVGAEQYHDFEIIRS